MSSSIVSSQHMVSNCSAVKFLNWFNTYQFLNRVLNWFQHVLNLVSACAETVSVSACAETVSVSACAETNWFQHVLKPFGN